MHANKLIQDFISRFQARKWDSMSAILPIAQFGPDGIIGFIEAVIQEIPNCHTYTDAALSFLPLEDWPQVVRIAVNALLQDKMNQAAQSVIRCASLQCPGALHPYLEQLFELMEYHFHQACRGANLEDVMFLFGYCNSEDWNVHYSACEGLLETRIPDVMKFVKTCERNHYNYLFSVGFEESNDGFRQLYSDKVLHLAFPVSYLDRMVPDMGWAANIDHPTWVMTSSDRQPYRFGGVSEARCGLCGEQVPHLITLDPVPDGIGITGLARVELAVCLSCLGWKKEILFYQHNKEGRPRALDYAESFSTPQFVEIPLEETTVNLVDLGARWRWQEWNNENLHRLGGHPTWIQSAEYSCCPVCERTSSFLMQLNSDLRDGDGHQFLWGTGGIGYVFWCDQCKVSSFLWQCT